MDACRLALSRKLPKPIIHQIRTIASFQQKFYSCEGFFVPLFRILGDFYNYSRRGMNDGRTILPNWQPGFDVSGTRVVYGLPGISKRDIHVAFTEPQTVVISRKTERVYAVDAPAEGFVDCMPMSGAIIQGGEESKSTIGQKVETVSHDPGFGATEKGKSEAENHVEKAKFWLTERPVREFPRDFHSPIAFSWLILLSFLAWTSTFAEIAQRIES